MIIELTLDSGSRIAIDSDSIAAICEIKDPKVKGSKSKTNVKLSADDAGWDVKEAFDTVLERWNVAQR